MDFVIKKTTELTNSEILGFCALFEEIFEQPKTLSDFRNEFFHTAFGFSFHALMRDGDELVGSHSLIPCHYMVDNTPELMAFSVDTMIKKGYRDFFNLKDLVELTEQEARKNDIRFIFGFPNDHSYPILKKGLKYQDIGRMGIYIYPYRMGGIKPGLRFLNGLSMLFCRSYECFSTAIAKKKKMSYLLEKDRVNYDVYRYKWFDAQYEKVQINDFHFVYRIMTYGGVRTAFLLDMNEVSSHNIARAVSYIRKKDGKRFDLLMYVGHLSCHCSPLLKVPRKFEPKSFNFTGKFLDIKNQDKRFFDIENWNVNLSCYDLL